jgi:hypothetical protein
MLSNDSLIRTAGSGDDSPERIRTDDLVPALFTAATLFVISILELFSGCVGLAFAFLRETHEFWLNSGGYPIVLRDLVLVGYYPLMLIDLGILIGLTIVPCAKLKTPRGFLKYQLLLLVGGWVLLVASIGVSAENNLVNFWQNRPLHYKPPVQRQ